MTDKIREDFEAWHLKQYTKFDCGNKDDRVIVWQAATLAERERCAAVYVAAHHNPDQELIDAIRSGK